MLHKLLEEEKTVENEIDKLVPVSDEKKRKIERIIDTARKNRSISMRISEYDLERIKEKAHEEGIPYQTLINSILHKYVTNQLLERHEIVKFVQFVKKGQKTT